MRARMKRWTASAAVLVIAAAAVVAGRPGTGSAAAVPSLQAFGIAGNGTLMLAFKTDTPQQNDWVRRITGLVGDTAVIGADWRVQDNKVYVVGNQGGIYTVGIPSTIATKVSQLQVALYGTRFGVDFNPAADRLRVFSDNGQNLRHDLTGHSTVEDTTLTTPPGTGPAKGVTAGAYTNNDLNAATNTTLFDINTTTDQVVIQSPANNGFLVATGSLGFDAGPDAGFDIFTGLSGGKAVSSTAFAVLTPAGGFPTLYSVDLLTGAAAAVGEFPLDVSDLALSPAYY